MNTTKNSRGEPGVGSSRSRAGITALFTAVFLSACGGDSSGSAPAPAPSPAPVPSPSPAPAPSAAPTITMQPVAQSVTTPSAATFTVVATGSPSPTYQWQASSDAGATFSGIAGAISASYTTPGTTTSDSGKQFRVVVTNSAGSVTSNAATLTVAAVGSATLAGYPYAVSIDSTGTLWVSVLPNIYTTSSQFAGLVQSVSPSGNVVTLAGSATQGFVNATGTAAQFTAPQGVAEDSVGNVYVADTGDSVIRKITPGGIVSTFAGSGSVGATDGTGTAASFFAPRAVAIDSGGNIYVADRNNNAIRKISPAGVVTTLAGGVTSGHADGTGSAASFSAPAGVAVDAAGNLYVADSGNNAIRKISPGGVVTTLAGNAAGSGLTDGTGAAARFTGPSGIAVDGAGTVYVADSDNQAIRKVTPSGVVTTLAGTGSAGFVNGTGTAASFSTPLGVTVDASGNLFIADSGNHAIRKVTAGGVVTTLVN